MMRFIYRNYYDPKVDGFASRICELQEIQNAPKELSIEADNILVADVEYERVTGVNPARHKKHTPPILVSIIK